MEWMSDTPETVMTTRAPAVLQSVLHVDFCRLANIYKDLKQPTQSSNIVYFETLKECFNGQSDYLQRRR